MGCASGTQMLRTHNHAGIFTTRNIRHGRSSTLARRRSLVFLHDAAAPAKGRDLRFTRLDVVHTWILIRMNIAAVYPGLLD